VRFDIPQAIFALVSAVVNCSGVNVPARRGV